MTVFFAHSRRSLERSEPAPAAESSCIWRTRKQEQRLHGHKHLPRGPTDAQEGPGWEEVERQPREAVNTIHAMPEAVAAHGQIAPRVPA